MTDIVAGESPLIDRFLPRADVSERHETMVRAPADIVFQVAENFDLRSIPIVRGVFWLRGKIVVSKAPPPAWPRGLLAETTAIGWGLLARRPGRELVAGAATQPWLAEVKFRPIPADEFADFAEPGFVKIAWTIEAEPPGQARTIVRTRTRALATDEEARKKFRSYWRKFGASIIPIRLLVLPAIRREAERRYRRFLEARGNWR